MREALADFFGMLEYKTRHNVLCAEDVAVLLAAIREAGGVRATVKDIAGYYGQSEDNVRHVINRNIMPAPKRCVYYDFGVFRKRVPAKWTNRASLPAD